MSDDIKINRPVQQTQPRQEYNQPQVQEVTTERRASKKPWIILAVLVVLLAVGGVVFRDKLFSKQGGSAKVLGASVSAYQAVFLTNGQVYFGRIADQNSDYVTLSDIYYLQVGPQQGSGTQATSTAQQQISLVKLGNELHGPVDEMHISRQQILFYENLKDDGQVVKAIILDKTGPKK